MTEKQQQEKNPVTKKRTLRRVLLWVVLFLLFFLLISPLLIHLSPVQNWLLDRATNRLSKSLGTEISVSEVDFSVFDGLVLEGVYVADPLSKGDTLAYIRKFSGSLEENFLSVFSNQLNLHEIYLSDVELYIKKLEGQEMSNFESLFKYDNSNNTETSSGQRLDLDLKIIHLNDVKVNINDVPAKVQSHISVKEGIVDIKEFDAQKNKFHIKRLLLAQPTYQFTKSGEEVTSTVTENEKTISPKDVELIESEIQSSLQLDIDHVEISEGIFQRDDWYKSPQEKGSALDTDHLSIKDINLNADSTFITFPFTLDSHIKSLTLSEDNGFDINRLEVEQLHVSTTELVLNNFILDTGDSQLGEQLRFDYNQIEDFKSFAQKIEIDANLQNSHISFSDLSYFFPDLNASAFVSKNKNKWVDITGDISGTVDEMEADNLELSFSNLIELKGYLSTMDLTKSESALINLHVDKFNTSLSNLERIIPDFKIPDQFYKLDPIIFTGDIDGFLKDFVVFGTLNSPLGKVDLDTRLDIKQGVDLAKYSGTISVEDFDMKSWTDNDELGFATFSAEIEDGQGLTLNNVYTDLSAELASFDYRGYRYSDVRLDGEFEKNLFNGRFTSSDPNAKMDFDGEISLIEGQVFSDFVTDIEHIDLTQLNLSNDISKIDGYINMKVEGSDYSDFIGTADVKEFSLNYKGEEFRFDSLLISSSPQNNGFRSIILTSDIVNGTLGGVFDFNDLIPAVQDHIWAAHPAWAEKLNVKRNRGIRSNQKFAYKLEVNDTKTYLNLAELRGLRLKKVKLQGSVDVAEGVYESDISVGEVIHQDNVYSQIDIDISEQNKDMEYALSVDGIKLGTQVFEPIDVVGTMDGDNAKVRVMTKNLLDSIQLLDLTFHIYPKDDFLIGSVADNTLQMFSSSWTVNPANKIRYGDKTLDIHKFKISDGYRTLYVDDINKRGVKVDLNNFDFLTINGFIAYDKIAFSGRGDLAVRKEDIFDPSPASLDLSIDTFALNNTDYGKLDVSVTDTGSDTLLAKVLLERASDGMYLETEAIVNKRTKSLDGTISANDLPMETFEFIIDDGISNTGGNADVFNGRVYGSLDDVKLYAQARVDGGTTTIDYLGAQLFLGDEIFKVTDSEIDLSGTTVTDKNGNIATMDGGLFHKTFKDFTTELTMQSDYFLALDTDKLDNPSYYGQGVGDLVVEFSGPFSSTDILVAATTGRGTEINIPVGSVYADYDQHFIKTVSRDDVLGDLENSILQSAPTLEGVDIRMDLTITEDARINIIFDESRNDIISGVGNGDMRVVVSREGDFNIFGDYVIERGDYLFTYFRVVSKPFSLLKGGQITWTGDPINANINLEANYEKLRAPMTTFLNEFLSPANEGLARPRTDVDLKLFIQGTLYKPSVTFDIEFPELQGEMRALAESKMRVLRENEADMNEQVAGLIMFGSFLPSSSLGNQVGSAVGIAQTGYNTLSEMISNQLSHFLSGFLQEALTENGFVSGIDFELGFTKDANLTDLNNPQAPNNSGNNSFIPDEVEVHLKPRFQNDRWEIDYGTSIVNNRITNASSQSFLIHDFVIGFHLTDDRRLKLKAYGKWDRILATQPGQKFGFGLNYRKEFGSLTEFKAGLVDEIAKLKKDSNSPGQ